MFTFEEMNSDTSVMNNECGFGMPSDSLGKPLMFTRESGKPFVDILLGSAKGKSMLQFKLAGGFHKDFILIAICQIISKKFSRVT